MKIVKTSITTSLLVTAVLVGSSAEAGLTYNDDANLTVGVESGTLTVGSGAVKLDGTSEGNFYLGAITLTGTLFGQHTSFDTVCTDLRGVVYIGTSYHFSDQQYNGMLTGLNPHWGNDNAGSSFDQASASAAIQNAADIFATHSSATSYGVGVTRAEWWAALQLAVWDALYNTRSDGTIDTSSSARFSINTSVITDAKITSLVSSWLVESSTAYAGDILVPIVKSGSTWVPDGPPNANPGAQGMMFNVTPVPEPTTVLSALLLLLPVATRGLRSLRRIQSE